MADTYKRARIGKQKERYMALGRNGENYKLVASSAEEGRHISFLATMEYHESYYNITLIFGGLNRRGGDSSIYLNLKKGDRGNNRVVTRNFDIDGEDALEMSGCSRNGKELFLKSADLLLKRLSDRIAYRPFTGRDLSTGLDDLDVTVKLLKLRYGIERATLQSNDVLNERALLRRESRKKS